MNALTLIVTGIILSVTLGCSILYSLGGASDLHIDRVILTFSVCIPLFIISFCCLFDITEKE